MEPPWQLVKAMFLAAAVFLAIAICINLAGCTKPLPPPVPPTDWDGGTATCEAACARLQQLGCPSGKPTPKGAPCVAVCRNVMDSGLIEWNLDCIARAVSCGETDVCAR
jgi:hypothetical protein